MKVSSVIGQCPKAISDMELPKFGVIVIKNGRKPPIHHMMNQNKLALRLETNYEKTTICQKSI